MSIKYIRLYLLLSNFVFSVAVFIAPVLLEAQNTPNILIIVCDDLNDSIAGMGGHPQAKTPNIDRLAARGVTFMNAASNVPLCGPSRASMWSGLLPTTTGYYGYSQQVNHWQ